MEKYTKSDFDNLHKFLQENSDEKYRAFNESLIPGSEGSSYGIRVPALRSVAKKILRQDWRGFLTYAKADDTYEMIMLHGMVVALAKISFAEKLELFAGFIPRVNNWAFCDIVCGDLKDMKEHRKEGYSFLKQYLSSEKEFEVRVAVVLLLEYYLTEEYIDRALEKLIEVKQEGYYVKMAVAWTIAEAYVKFPDKTHPILKNGLLDADTHNKAIQKIRDSYRVSKEQKEILKSMKRELK